MKVFLKENNKYLPSTPTYSLLKSIQGRNLLNHPGCAISTEGAGEGKGEREAGVTFITRASPGGEGNSSELYLLWFEWLGHPLKDEIEIGPIPHP